MADQMNSNVRPDAEAETSSLRTQKWGALAAFLVSLTHFWEVSISTGIFRALCAGFAARPKYGS